MQKLFYLFIFIIQKGIALDLDKRMIGRILAVSDTKKTVLINKGSEHGIKEKDHIKIALPEGLIARAIAVKTSPSRSVWSIYRFYAKDRIEKNIAITMKGSSPIKLTSDESKSLGQLAKEVDKKEEPLPKISATEKKKQNRLRTQILKSEKIISQYDDVDYSSLNDDGKKLKTDPDIDWSGVDGAHDSSESQSSVDYSSIHSL